MSGDVPFGSLRQRGERWQLRWRVGGRETSTTHATRDAALAESHCQSALNAAGRHALYVGGNLSVSEVARLWMRSASHAHSTRATEWSHLRSHILPVLGDVPLRQLSRVRVEGWARDLDRDLSPKTRLRIVRVLTAVVQFGLVRGWVEEDPCAHVTVDGARSRKQLDLPTIEQVVELRDEIDPRFAFAVDLGAWVGCTIGELAAVRRSDVDLDLRTVHVHSARRRADDGSVVIDQKMKTPTRDRVVKAVPGFVWDRWAESLPERPEDMLVTAPGGGVLAPGNYRARVWRPAVKAVFGEPSALVPHDLRHFAISVWLAAGASVLDAADWAGHTSPSLIEGTYSHSLPRTGSEFETEVLGSVLAARSFPRLRSVEGSAA